MSVLTLAFDYLSGAQEDKESLERRKRLEEDYPIDILTVSPIPTTAPLPDPPSLTHDPDAMDTGEIEVEQEPHKWWWDDDPDDDDKEHWFMPIMLGLDGRVENGWEDLY